jgi:3-oxoacyl-[acyl-carrier protein] reductase
MELGLTNKKVFITGGASGIGKAIVKEFLKEGSFVVFTSRKQESINALYEDFQMYEDSVKGICVDVSEYDSVQKVKAALGDLNLTVEDFDVLVNNVGDTLGVTDHFCTLDDWRRVYRLNLEVHVEYVNLFTPAMIRRKWGRVVNILQVLH